MTSSERIGEGDDEGLEDGAGDEVGSAGPESFVGGAVEGEGDCLRNVSSRLMVSSVDSGKNLG